jgi:hypothetical protein
MAMSTIKKISLYSLLFIVVFLVGILVWKVTNNTFYAGLLREDHMATTVKDIDFSKKLPEEILLNINQESILKKDLDFTLNVMFANMSQAERSPLNPPVESSYMSEKPPFHISTKFNQKDFKFLQEQALNEVIERTILFQYIKGDKNFNTYAPERYNDCKKDAHDTYSEMIWLNTPEHRADLEKILCQKSIISQYIQEVVYSFSEPTDQTLTAFYEANKAQFKIPEMVTIRQIVLKDEKKAKELRDILTPQNFERYAKEYSITPEGELGGLLPPFAYDHMPEGFNVSFSLNKHQISQVIKSSYGFHIMMLENKRRSYVADFSKVRDDINQSLMQEKRQEAYTQWVELAINFAKINFQE